MILCCGESLIDMLPRDGGDDRTFYEPVAGGAVYNTAIAAGRLGAAAGFVGGISSDFFGEILRDGLRESGVHTRYSVITDRPTTLAFVRLVDGHASYAFYDENTAGRMLDKGDVGAFDETPDVLFFGGISLVAEPCGSTYEALMMREAGSCVTMLDPNIRPGFITDEPAYRARIERMIGAADIVKLSDEDLKWLHGQSDLDAMARSTLAAGPKLVVITRGAEGAIGYSERWQVEMNANAVTVVDTVGAGDTFNAGLLVSLQEAGRLTKDAIGDLGEEEIRAALQLGQDAAAITVSRPGANPPFRGEISR